MLFEGIIKDAHLIFFSEYDIVQTKLPENIPCLEWELLGAEFVKEKTCLHMAYDIRKEHNYDLHYL